MLSLRKLASIAVVLSAVVVSQAKTNYAYVANNGGSSNTVSVIDTANNTVVTTITVGANPWGVAVNQAGSVAYVTNSNSATVSVIKTSTNTAAGPSRPLREPATPDSTAMAAWRRTRILTFRGDLPSMAARFISGMPEALGTVM
jgi:YVTN family beta-propeller protein